MDPKSTLQHLTLNTGHLVAQPCPEILRDPRIARSLRILATNGGDLGAIHSDLAGWDVDTALDTGCAAYSIRYHGLPVVECGVCWDAAQSQRAFAQLEDLYLSLSDQAARLMAATAAPECPQKIPWLCVVLLPSWIASPFAAATRWLGDAERCLAWAIIDACQNPDKI